MIKILNVLEEKIIGAEGGKISIYFDIADGTMNVFVFSAYLQKKSGVKLAAKGV